MPRVEHIWIIRALSGNPFDKSQRPERAVLLASYLASKGYKITFWGTDYDHAQKVYINGKTTYANLNENEDVILLHVPNGYKKNISLRRFFYVKEMSKVMKKELKNSRQSVPDLIFISYPTEGDCRVILEYGRKHRIPVIIDVRDMWPDIFETAVPSILRPLGQLVINHLKRKTSQTISRASAICATSPFMLHWGLNYAGRELRTTDRSIFIACKKVELSIHDLTKNIETWENIGVSKRTWNICYFSTLSKMAADLDTVIDAINEIYLKHPQIRFVIGGKGDDEERLKSRILDSPCVKMTGWVNSEQMASIMSISKAGMLYTLNSSSVRNAWGNKVGQYLSYGLPLITCAEGVAKEYINANNCGILYNEKNARSLVEQICQLIEDSDKLGQLSKNASKCFYRDFDEDVVMQQFENMIQEVYDTSLNQEL